MRLAHDVSPLLELKQLLRLAFEEGKNCKISCMTLLLVDTVRLFGGAPLS